MLRDKSDIIPQDEDKISPTMVSPRSPRSLPSLSFPPTLTISVTLTEKPLRSGLLSPISPPLTNEFSGSHSSSQDHSQSEAIARELMDANAELLKIYPPFHNKHGKYDAQYSPNECDSTNESDNVVTEGNTTRSTASSTSAGPTISISHLTLTSIEPAKISSTTHNTIFLTDQAGSQPRQARAKNAKSGKEADGRARVTTEDTNAASLVQRWATATRGESDEEKEAMGTGIDDTIDPDDDDDAKSDCQMSSNGFKLNDGWEETGTNSSSLKLGSSNSADPMTSRMSAGMRGGDAGISSVVNGSPQSTAAATTTATTLQSVMVRPKEVDPLTFLVVDDEESSRRLIRDLLETQLGHKVLEAADGANAFRIIRWSMSERGSPIDAVFIDYMMPVMNGAVTARRIKDIGYKGELYGLTSTMSTIALAFVSAGVSMVCEKPLGKNLVIRLVHALRTKQMRLRAAPATPAPTLASTLTSASLLSSATQPLSLVPDSKPIYARTPRIQKMDVHAPTPPKLTAANAPPTVKLMSLIKTTLHMGIKGLGPDALTFLVVDDALTCRKMARHILEQQLGQHVIEAEDGGIAIKLMRKNLAQGEGGATADGRGGAASRQAIDVVLMDYMMPLMNGAATCKKMRDMGFRGPIYGVTMDVVLAVQGFLFCDISDLIVKPLKRGVLQGIIQDVQTRKAQVHLDGDDA